MFLNNPKNKNHQGSGSVGLVVFGSKWAKNQLCSQWNWTQQFVVLDPRTLQPVSNALIPMVQKRPATQSLLPQNPKVHSLPNPVVSAGCPCRYICNPLVFGLSKWFWDSAADYKHDLWWPAGKVTMIHPYRPKGKVRIESKVFTCLPPEKRGLPQIFRPRRWNEWFRVHNLKNRSNRGALPSCGRSCRVWAPWRCRPGGKEGLHHPKKTAG